MDRVDHLRGEAGGSGDTTLDSSSPPSEAYMTAANESSSNFYSLADSSYDINPIKDVSLASTTVVDQSADDDLISNLSPIGKKDMDTYKIGKQIEAANILSGGVNIFDDNENSFDGHELVIDDNGEIDDKSEDKTEQFKDESTQQTLLGSDNIDIPSKNTEVLLQIDGKNVDAIDIGNGLYLYRKDGREELAAVQIIDDGQQQPTFKFLKVRENAEGNLEVYEEIEIEIPKEVPIKEGSGSVEKNPSHVPVKDINKVINEASITKLAERKSPQKQPTTSTNEVEETNDDKEVGFNGKMMKFSESRKSPVVGSFTPMTFHSTPNKEGKPLTKTMVDQQLHPNRHSDNVKKTIEVHTDSNKRAPDTPTKKFDTTKYLDCTEGYSVETIDQEKEIKDEESEDLKENKLVIVEKNDKKLEDEDNKAIGSDKLTIDEDKVLNDGQITNKKLGKVSEVTLTAGSKKPSGLVIDTTNEQNQKAIEDKVLEKKDIIDTVKCADLEKSASETTSKGDIRKKTSSIPETKETAAVENNSNEKVQETKIEIVSNITKKVNEQTKSKITVEEIDKISPTQAENKLKDVNKDVDKQETDNTTTIKNISSDDLEKHHLPPDKNIIPDKIVQERNLPAEKINMDKNITANKKDNTIPIDKFAKDAEEKVAMNKMREVIPKTTEQVQKPSKTELLEGMAKPLQVTKTEKNETMITVEKKVQTSYVTSNIPIRKNKTTDIASANKPSTDLEVSKLLQSTKQPAPSSLKQEASVDTGKVDQNPPAKSKIEPQDNKNMQTKSVTETKPITQPINNNHSAVPFGKWTEVNRQEFLNKFKEVKVPVSSNSKQIKNSNDLNRRDVLKKIDSQRQSNIASSKDKPNVKNETIFSNKVPSTNEIKISVKKDAVEVKPKVVEPINVTKKEPVQTAVASSTVTSSTSIKISSTSANKSTKKEPASEKDNPPAMVAKTEPAARREVNVNDLINKTIEDMINKVVPGKSAPEEPITNPEKEQTPKKELPPVKEKIPKTETTTSKSNNNEAEPTPIDDIEMKMNELHGIPFVERPPHELPKVYKPNKKDKNNPQYKNDKKPDSSTKPMAGAIIDVDSEEEIIEHEPITGDIDLNKKNIPKETPVDTKPKIDKETHSINKDPDTKPEAVITEKDFDKFARRNSKTFENCLTVNFDSKEPNVVQNVVEKNVPVRAYHKNELIRPEPQKQPLRLNTYPGKVPPKKEEINKNLLSKNKIHIAYQSVLTAKMDRQPRMIERPITIIEDKPVKVVFMDSNAAFVADNLNAQGQELSPNKKQLKEDETTASTTDSASSEVAELIEVNKQIDDAKTKKHQRKQVLTPVETPDLELIQPSDLGVDVSPKKKRKTDVESKSEKNIKNLVHKKSYLLGRSATDDNIQDSATISPKETNKLEEVSEAKNTTSALDNLVKAAELIEHQSEHLNKTSTPLSDSPQDTPAKRGRGRPRKNPLPENAAENKVLSPQKKPKLIDAKPLKEDVNITDEESSDEQIVKENWTMGKINENIVCPICNKLFRSENVVFKHVKHCTGVSPNRSESDNRSPRRSLRSQESEKSFNSQSDMEIEEEDIKEKESPTKKSSDPVPKPEADKTEINEIEDIPVKEKLNNSEKDNDNDEKQNQKRSIKSKINTPTSNLVCEICGKMFRQLSYLVNHKLQHKKEEVKKQDKETETNKLQVFSCNVCKKVFRKLHHLVQHRIIHNPNAPTRTLRKSSSENENKAKAQPVLKQNEDQSAAFRCEPCDKSFRKLHHLVEHRETHDGINRQKTNTSVPPVLEKPTPTPQCDVCKKTFRKIHHLIEHKEQHVETSSEKSDDKSVKSCLSTKDIIHECSLCYMVFPNEHSLNKHTGICSKKKRQSKLAKDASEDSAKSDDNIETEEKKEDIVPTIIAEEIIDDDYDMQINDRNDEIIIVEKKSEEPTIKETPITTEIILKDTEKSLDTQEEIEKQKEEIKVETPSVATKRDRKSTDIESSTVIPEKIKKMDNVKTPVPRKKTPVKEKVAATVTKRQKSNEKPSSSDKKSSMESNDDDEIRYMINPAFKVEETNESKTFMKVRSNKRNSLQIERPNSKDLVKRRTSLQHPPKIPRLKPKPVEPKIIPTKIISKSAQVEYASTDSDDSDVKYSFPKPPEKSTKTEEVRKKPGRKSLADKRKSLGGIAKRKSTGQMTVQNKTKPLPTGTIKKRQEQAEHRCDCGQLFSSAALLARHTSLAHTPPRIRRRRDAPPPPPPRGKPPAPAPAPKPRRTPAHKGVPVPDKMRKLMTRRSRTGTSD